jgi:hypothetical protein
MPRHFSLKIITHSCAAPQSAEICDFPLRLPATRFVQSAIKCVKSTPQNVGPARFNVAVSTVVADVRSRTSVIRYIGHGIAAQFSSECGESPPLRAQPYSSHKCERSPSHGYPVIGQTNRRSLALSSFISRSVITFAAI